MTTAQGHPIADDQNWLTAGPRGPQLLEDQIARELAASEGKDDNAVDSRLLVHIQGLSGLVNRSVHGVCNPYCRVVLDARTLDTRAHGDATTAPDFRKVR